jgi:hypothetical protein
MQFHFLLRSLLLAAVLQSSLSLAQEMTPETKALCKQRMNEFLLSYYQPKVDSLKAAIRSLTSQLRADEKVKIEKMHQLALEDEGARQSRIEIGYTLRTQKESLEKKEAEVLAKVKDGTIQPEDTLQLRKLSEDYKNQEAQQKRLWEEFEARQAEAAQLQEPVAKRFSELTEGAFIQKTSCDWDCEKIARDNQKLAEKNPLKIAVHINHQGVLRVDAFLRGKATLVKVYDKKVDLQDVFVTGYLDSPESQTLQIGFRGEFVYAAEEALLILMAKKYPECRTLNYDSSGRFTYFDIAL